MTTALTELQWEMLRRVGKISWAASTGYFRTRGGVEIAAEKARRALHRLASLGLVEPVRSRGGLAFWWKIKPEGRAELARVAEFPE